MRSCTRRRRSSSDTPTPASLPPSALSPVLSRSLRSLILASRARRRSLLRSSLEIPNTKAKHPPKPKSSSSSRSSFSPLPRLLRRDFFRPPDKDPSPSELDQSSAHVNAPHAPPLPSPPPTSAVDLPVVLVVAAAALSPPPPVTPSAAAAEGCARGALNLRVPVAIVRPVRTRRAFAFFLPPGLAVTGRVVR